MSLLPYDPFRHFEDMRKELDRFFTNDLPAFHPGFGPSFSHLNIDVHETEKEVVAVCDIPGLEKKEDVTIDIEYNVLSISGSINRTNKIAEENMHIQERFMGQFQRSVVLPSAVSSEGVKCAYKNGVLEIRMPKVKPNRKKIVDVDFD